MSTENLKEFESDILGFIPTELNCLSENPIGDSSSDSNIYKPVPSASKSDDGCYRATIKVVYDPHNRKASIFEQQQYALQDSNGFFTVTSSLTNGDKSCPIFKAWKKCHFAQKGSTLWMQAARESEGGNQLFDKRFSRWCIIQVIEDKNQPDLKGKYLFWKLPKSVYDEILKKMNPDPESGRVPIPVLDWLFGRSIDLIVKPGPKDPNAPDRENRERSYTCEISDEPVAIINPDGTSVFSIEEQEIYDKYVYQMSKLWGKRRTQEELKEEMSKINADDNTSKFRDIYSKILDQLKKLIPSIEEHFGYHEWPDSIKDRVQSWINIVLEGKNPATAIENVSEGVINDIDNVTTSTTAATATTTTASDVTDDLPF